MTNTEFYELFERLHQQELETMKNKGLEYTKNSGDKLKNFKEVAQRTGTTSLQTWSVYFMKHIFSLEHWLNGGDISSGESIESRILDLRNYLALLVGLIKDKE